MADVYEEPHVPAATEEPVAGEDYEVGYCKPPLGSQFKPGQSGNPAGRPKGAKNLHTIMSNLLAGLVRMRTSEGERRVSRLEATAWKNYDLAIKGNSRAIDRIFAFAAALADGPHSGTGRASSRTPEETTAADNAALDAFRSLLLAEFDTDAADDPDSEDGGGS